MRIHSCDEPGRLLTVDEVEAAGGFPIVYADPAWSYSDATPRGGAERHYRTMSLAELKALPVSRLAARDAVLFLWATWPTLPDAFEVIEAWGFRYKTLGFAWVKTRSKGAPHIGLGHWTRANTEPCLLAVRGSIKRVNAGVRQVLVEDENTLVAPLGRHSAKPPEARDRIVRLMGDLPRLELFARDWPAGWDVWGDEVPNQEAA